MSLVKTGQPYRIKLKFSSKLETVAELRTAISKLSTSHTAIVEFSPYETAVMVVFPAHYVTTNIVPGVVWAVIGSKRAIISAIRPEVNIRA